MGKNKAPPVLREGVVYATWKKELSAWELLTDTDKKKRGVQVYLEGLEGRFKQLVSKIPIEDLNKDEGVKTITDKLDTYCSEDESQRA